jgi:O-antigen/teichoic acid export membrane protein
MATLGRATVVYTVGIVLSRAVSFVMLPFYTRYLSPADYGVMQLVDMSMDIAAIFAGTRIASAVFRYYTTAETEEQRRSVLATAGSLLVISYFLIAALVAAIAVPASRFIFGTTAYATLLQLSAASMAASALFLVPMAAMRAEGGATRYTIATTVKLVLQVGLNILFLAGFSLGVTGIYVATLIANLALALWIGGPFLFKVGVRISKPVAAKLLRYGVPLIGTQIATFAATYADRYFLKASGTLTIVGIYSLAYQFGFILSMIGFNAFAMVWEPVRFQYADRPDRDAVFSRAFLYMNLLLLTAALGICVFVEDFIHLMTTPPFYSAATLVPVIVLAYVLQSWATFYEAGVLIKERTEFVTLANWIAAIVALIGYWVLVPLWLAWGAAVATVISFAVRLICTYVASQRLLRIDIEWSRVVRLLGLVGVAYTLRLLLPNLGFWPSVSLSTLIIVAYGLAVWFSGVIPPADRARALAYLQQFSWASRAQS